MSTNFNRVEVNKADLFMQGRLYPEDMVIYAKPATVADIRRWSNMNPNNPVDSLRHVQNIIASCIEVESTIEGKRYSYKDLYINDRLALLLIINSITFEDRKTHGLFVNGECANTHCGYKCDKIAVQPANVSYDNIDEKYMKYVDAERGLFAIKTQHYGIIELKPLTIGMFDAISAFQQEKFKPEFVRDNLQMFNVIACSMLDWRKASVSAMYRYQVETFNMLKPEEYEIRRKLAEEVSKGLNGHFEFVCPDCGETFRCTIQSDDDFKSMFVAVQDIDAELC
jgi:hypothetical protein